MFISVVYMLVCMYIFLLLFFSGTHRHLAQSLYIHILHLYTCIATTGRQSQVPVQKLWYFMNKLN